MKLFFISIILFSSLCQASVSHLVNGCRIFTMDGLPLKVFPGDICLFFADGSFISTSPNAIRKFSVKDEIQWEISGNYHHQLELDSAGKHILAMSNEVKDGVRYDSFEVIDLSGKIIHRTTSDKLFFQTRLTPPVQPTSEFIRTNVKAEKEVGHFNSFYPVPSQNSSGKRPEYIKEGNFIVNSLSEGVFILSPDLKRVIHHFRIKHSFDHQVHDVQITESGKFMYFNNRSSEGGPVNRFSAIQILDPSGKLEFSYTSDPPEFFYSHACGGVQELGEDEILFSDVQNATYFYSRKSRKLKKAVTGTHRNSGRPWNSPTQRVKAYDLGKFLRLRKIK